MGMALACTPANSLRTVAPDSKSDTSAPLHTWPGTVNGAQVLIF